MFERTVIIRTGQGWKAIIAFGGLTLGAVVSLCGPVLSRQSSSDFGVLVQMGGAVFGLVAFFFGCRSIRCPSCGSRWVWEAISRHSANRWLSALLTKAACPACGYPDNTRDSRNA